MKAKDAFRPEMIALRRRMLSMSQADLSHSSKISQAAISKLEQGLKAPSDRQVEQIAIALSCPETFFFQGEREYGPPLSTHPIFRRKASVGQKVMDKVIAEFNVRLGHARVLLQHVDFEPELKLPHYDADDYTGRIDEIAVMVRGAWYVPRGPIRSIMDYIERAGILVIFSDMEGARIDGASYQVPGLPPVIFLNKELPGDRQRFTLAHELGHIVMHTCPTPEMEKQADEFAAEFLMPKADIASELSGLSLQKAAQLKPYWKVSMGALIVRAKTLGKIDTGTASYLWRQMSIAGYRTKEPVSLDFAAETPSLSEALIRNLTHELGYSNTDLEHALHLHYSELAEMYNLKPETHSNILRLVR